MDDSIKFVREKDYKFVKELGEGSFGKTVLLYDEDIEEYFVCKKYQPDNEEWIDEYYEYFVNEIKIMYQLYYENLVRIFSYHLYPKEKAGYIIMEYIEGESIEEYLKNKPEKTNDIFQQIIKGFKYLEKNKVLHRDIRPTNILIDKNDKVKIIDFGFGKKVTKGNDFNKSVSLNWWCDLPMEFEDRIYDFSTEVYFIGNLFQKIISLNEIESFNFGKVLKKMIERNPKVRIGSFTEIENQIIEKETDSVEFSESEKLCFKQLEHVFKKGIVERVNGTQIIEDDKRIESNLINLLQRVDLLEDLPSIHMLIRSFISGYFKYIEMPLRVSQFVEIVKFYKYLSPEKRRRVLLNLGTILSSKDIKYNDDDLPF